MVAKSSCRRGFHPVGPHPKPHNRPLTGDHPPFCFYLVISVYIVALLCRDNGVSMTTGMTFFQVAAGRPCPLLILWCSSRKRERGGLQPSPPPPSRLQPATEGPKRGYFSSSFGGWTGKRSELRLEGIATSTHIGVIRVDDLQKTCVL